MSTITETVTVVGLERAYNSANGNPSWYVVDDRGVRYKTAPDAQVGYSIDNAEMLGRLPVRAELTIETTPQGRHIGIIDVRLAATLLGLNDQAPVRRCKEPTNPAIPATTPTCAPPAPPATRASPATPRPGRTTAMSTPTTSTAPERTYYKAVRPDGTQEKHP